MQSIKTIRDLFINDFMSRLQLADADDFKFLLKSYRKLRWLGKDMTLELFGKRRIEGNKSKDYNSSRPSRKVSKRKNFDKSWKTANYIFCNATWLLICQSFRLLSLLTGYNWFSLAESTSEFDFLVLKSIAIQYLQESYVDKRSALEAR